MGMRYYLVESKRSAREQNYIMALCGCWGFAPDSVRERVQEQIRRAARGNTKESRALFSVLIREEKPKSVSERTGISLARVYEMRRDFIDSFPII